jgi:hypothetical protein
MSPQSNCVACQGALVCTYAGCVSIRGRVGDTCPQFIEALAEECGTHGQQAFSALAAPAHACTAKARFELLCAAFDHTGRAGPSLLAHLQVVHAPSALTNIASLALRHGGLFGALARRPQQLLCDACGPSLLAVRLPAVAPALARSVILTVQCLACGRQVAFGMIPVDALMTEMRHRLLPHPRDAIPAHQRRVGVFPPPLRLSPRQLAERFWAAEMRNIPDVARITLCRSSPVGPRAACTAAVQTAPMLNSFQPSSLICSRAPSGITTRFYGRAFFCSIRRLRCD